MSPEVDAMIRDNKAPTAPLTEFQAAYEQDDNIWWQVSCGHHQNLYEAAMDRVAELEQELRSYQ